MEVMRHRPDGIFNLGSGVGISIGDLARLILRQAGQPERPIEALQSSPWSNISIVDMSKLKSQWDWRPGFYINETVRLLLAGYSWHGEIKQSK